MPPSSASSASSAPSWSASAALALIRAYKYLISPTLTGSCRFVPTCADYTAEAIARHGFLRGTWLGMRRLSRCHPLGTAGYDPVPHWLGAWAVRLGDPRKALAAIGRFFRTLKSQASSHEPGA